MKFIKKTASVVCSLIIIIALGGYIFVRNFDLNRYKPYIEDIVFRETGRELKLNGDAKIGISLVPTVEINDVTFSNPEWALTPYMARFSNLEVKFALMPLLHKQIDVDKIILESPEIYLEQSATGQKNWEFQTVSAPTTVGTFKANSSSQGTEPKAKDASAALVVGLIADKIEIKDGVVSYIDAKTKNPLRIDLAEFELSVPGGDKPMNVSLEAKYNGEDIQADAQITSLASILNDQKAMVNAKIKAFHAQAVLEGTLEDLMGDIRYATQANLHSPSGNFGAPETSAELQISGDTKAADIDVQKLVVATNLVTGKVSVNWSKTKPVLRANLSGGTFDLRTLKKTSMLSKLDFSPIKEAQAIEAVPNDKIPYQYLTQADGQLNVRLNNLIVDDDTTLKDVNVIAALQGGVLKVSHLVFGIGNGAVNAVATVQALKQQINLTATGKNIKLQELEKDFITGKGGTIQILSGGETDFDIRLATRGPTWRALSENLDGQVVFVLDKSQIKTGRIDWLTNNIVMQILSVLKIDTTKVDKLNLSCAVVRTDLKDGVASFPTGVVFNAEELQLISSGKLNLRNDKLDFTIAPAMNKLASGNLTQALASFIKLGGTINNPKIKLDTASAMTTVVGAVMTSGASLGASALLDGNNSPCYTALQGTKFATRFPKPTGVGQDTKDVYNASMKETKQAVKDLGHAAKGFLKDLKSQLKGK